MSNLFNSYRYPRPSRRRAAAVSWFSCGPTTTSIANNPQKKRKGTANKYATGDAATDIVQTNSPGHHVPIPVTERSAPGHPSASHEGNSSSMPVSLPSTESLSSDSDSSMSISSPEEPEAVLPILGHPDTDILYVQCSQSEYNNASYYEDSFYNQYQPPSPGQPLRGSPKKAHTPKPILVSGGSDLYWRLPQVPPAPVDVRTGARAYAFETSRKLEDFQTQKEALVALRGAVQALRERWNRFGRVHGDISPQAIRICVKKVEELGIHAPSGDICEPSWNSVSYLKFKSVLSLSQLRARHFSLALPSQAPALDYLDDLESIYYTACFLCVEYIGPGSVRPTYTIPSSFQNWKDHPLSDDVIEWKKECLLNGPGLEEGEVSAYFGEPFVSMLKEMRQMVGDGYREKMGLPNRNAERVTQESNGLDTKKKNVWDERVSSVKHALAGTHSPRPSSLSSLLLRGDLSGSGPEKDFTRFLDIIDRGIKNLQDHFSKNAFQYLDGLEMERNKYDGGLDEHVFFQV